MLTPRVAFATSEDHASLTPEDQAVAHALAARGIQVDPLVWSHADPATLSQALVIIRSCWDYHHRPDEFLAWVDALDARGMRVLNAPATLRRNAHKQYLVDLAEPGVAVVPTRCLRRGSRKGLADIARVLGSDALVMKPAISASSFHTARLDARDADSAHVFDDAVAARDTLVQPFVEAITRGELSLIFLGGVFSHAVIKRAKAGDFRVQEEYGGRTEIITLESSVIEQAARVLCHLDPDALYARIDGYDQDGRFILTEAELIEPHLFLSLSDGAVNRFADAIATRLDLTRD